MLTDTRLRHLKPKEKLYKVNDRDGLYVAVTPAGTISFRYNYSINGRQETVTFGRYGVGGITLAEARERLNEANDSVMIYDSLSNRSSLLRLKKTRSYSHQYVL
ncbi:integrase [Citrobacter freundii]|nr:integrase [Citrobacter freundii]